MSEPQRYLVTGATAGIGRATALELARRGHALSLVGRSVEPLSALAAELRAAGAPVVDCHVADLSVVRQMQALAEAVQQGPVLDGVLLSAGVLEPKRKLSADGYELNYAVNHLHKLVLLQALAPRLASRNARVVLGAPVGRVSGSLSDVHGEKSWSMFKGIATSQWANDMLALELDRQYGNAGLSIIAWNPGSTRGTQLARSMPPWAQALFWLVGLTARSLHDVARQGADLITQPPTASLTWVKGKENVACPVKDQGSSAVWTFGTSLVAEALVGA